MAGASCRGRAGTLEGALGFQRQLGQTLVQRTQGNGLDAVLEVGAEAVVQAVRRGRVLHGNHDHLRGDLGILVADHDGLAVVGHGVVLALGHGLADGDGTEEVLDLAFHLVHIDVADDDDALQVRTIPLMIVGAQRVVGELVDHRHQTDGETTTEATGHQLLQIADQDAGEARVAHAPFLMDDSALLVDFLAVQRQVVAPVVQDEQAGVDGSLARGYIINIVNSLFHRGKGVQLCAELHADALKILDEGAVGEVFGAVEAHVLQEVCQTALALFFLNGTHLLRDVEEGLVLRFLIVAEVVRQSVVETADAHFLIHGQRLHHHLSLHLFHLFGRLGKRHCCRKRQQG